MLTKNSQQKETQIYIGTDVKVHRSTHPNYEQYLYDYIVTVMQVVLHIYLFHL